MNLLHHKGEFFEVRGLLNIRPSPQGKPVIISAGGSEEDRDQAARTSEVVFSIDGDLCSAEAFYQGQKRRPAKYGRAPCDLAILPALSVFAGRTDEEAREKLDALNTNIHPDVGRAHISVDLSVDMTGLPLGEPVPEGIIPKTTNGAMTYFNVMTEAIRKERLTVRRLYNRAASSRGDVNPVIGSPETVADRDGTMVQGRRGRRVHDPNRLSAGGIERLRVACRA
jgi:alkanesulfonate monooxygenase SsuD/methylene tetrahydromethanopterin reductase-like flavin-dependent oxidoreductase (luciferase family)